MKLSINAGLVAPVAQFAADNDDIRYYLQGIYVEPLPEGGVLIAATNGHAACMWLDKEGHADRHAILSVSDAAIKACKKNPQATLSLVDGRLVVLDAGTNSEIYVQPSEKDGDWEIEAHYPDLRRIIPELGERQPMEPVSPGLINLARKALKIASQGMFCSIVCSQYTGNGAIAVTSASEPNFLAIIMPMRAEPEDVQIPKFAIDYKSSKAPEPRVFAAKAVP